MSLGSNIHRLRTERGMSQGALADALGVSRQSVSKWETDSATPDLDRLIKMSQLFAVSLDELVTGEAPVPPEDTPAQDSGAASHPPPTIIIQQRPPMERRKLAGTILLCMGFFALLLFSLLGGVLTGLVFSLPFLLCGGICFLFRRRVGLCCGWACYLLLDYALASFTSIHWRTIRSYLPSVETSITPHFIIICIQLLLIGALIFSTAWSFRKKPIQMTKKYLALYGAGCLLWILSFLLSPEGHYGVAYRYVIPLVRTLMAVARSMGLAALLAVPLRLHFQKGNSDPD